MTSEEVSLRNRIAMRWQLQNFAGERVLLWSTMRAIRFALLFLAAALVSGCASFALAQAPAPSSASAPASAAAPATVPAPAPKHTISVTFDYDFTTVPPCSPTVKTKCVARFNVYDVSGAKAYPLYSIPVPAGASGVTRGITGASQPLLFESGKHRFAVTAQTDTGHESNMYACTVWAEVP